MHSTPTQVSAMSPATLHGVREQHMDQRVMLIVASFVVTGVLVTMGDFIVQLSR
jgi:hypothetical protein